jgi:3-isopropylmalate/(R)-2-methylmalate dehydratase small subunit
MSAGASPPSPVVEQVAGRGIPVRGDDIDTDRIIPARFLRCVTFDGIGEHAFEDDRSAVALLAKADRKLPLHPFDQPRFQGAAVLVVNRNFGCGSSREHAPQALLRRGVRACLGESFAEIFFGNCVALGIPCMTIPRERVEALQSAIEADPALELTLDLRAREVVAKGARTPGWDRLPASIPDGAREGFLAGTWDATGLLLEDPEEIEAVARALPYTRAFA